MHFIDTSVLVTLLTAEPMTAEVIKAVAVIDAPVISDWVLTEFASALALKSRIGGLPAAERAAAHAALDTLLDRSFAVLPVARRDFQHAASLCRDSRLVIRAGDALHLAMAIAHDYTLVTRDRDLSQAAELSSVPYIFLGEIR